MIECPKCKKKICESDQFCGFCGSNIIYFINKKNDKLKQKNDMENKKNEQKLIKEKEKKEEKLRQEKLEQIKVEQQNKMREAEQKKVILEQEKIKDSQEFLIQAEGNKFKAIKNFVDKYNVSNEVAVNYINNAYNVINNNTESTEINYENNNEIYKIVERNNFKSIPSIKEVKELYGYDLTKTKFEVEKVIENKKELDKTNNPNGIKKTIIVASSSNKKASSAITRGIVGSFILGPVGLLAGTTAKTKNTTTFMVVYNNGKQKTITVNNNDWQFNNFCKYLEK